MNWFHISAIPVWVFVVGGLFLYLLIGFIHAAVVSYWSGKNSRLWISLACESTIGFTLTWPIYDFINTLAWGVSKYDDLMNWFKKKGQESTLPPENSVTDVPVRDRYYDSR